MKLFKIALITIALCLGLTLTSNAQTNIISTDSLIGHWSYNDGTTKDLSGNGFDATIVGKPTVITGKIGKALNFSGASKKKEYTYVAHDNKMNVGTNNSVSISFWANISKDYKDSTMILGVVAKRLNASGNTDYIVFLEKGNIYWGTGDASYTGAWTYTKQPRKGSWVFVICDMEYDAPNGKYIKSIYFDNKLVKTESGTYKGAANTYDLKIAGSYDGNQGTNGFWGGLDEVRIYKRILTSKEKEKLYKETNPVTKKYLIGTVSTSDGNPLANSYIFNLADMDSTNQGVSKDTVKTDSLGRYIFEVKEKDSSYLVAFPDSAAYPNQMITYADSSLVFSGASMVRILRDTTIVNFKTLEGTNAGFNGFINGNVTNCTACKKASPAKNIRIILVDENKKFIKQVFTDNNGNFSVKGIPSGKIYFYADSKTATNKKAPFVLFDASYSKLFVNLTLKTSDLVIDETTTLNTDVTISNLINIYPNPSSSIFNIKSEMKNLIFRVTDINGKEVLSTQNKSIDLSAYNQGIYFLNTLQNGLLIQTNKLFLNK